MRIPAGEALKGKATGSRFSNSWAPRVGSGHGEGAREFAAVSPTSCVSDYQSKSSLLSAQDSHP